MSPKKKAAKTIQKPIITIELGLGCPKSNAPGRKSTANIATTSAGDPEQDRQRQAIAHQRLERPVGEHGPLRQPGGGDRVPSSSRAGLRRWWADGTRRDLRRCTVHGVEVAVEIRDGADPEVIECIGRGSRRTPLVHRGP